ncbi:hypothetical protein ACFE04_011918 [Oxalis oulophora]
MEIINNNGENCSLILIKQGAEARVFESNFVGRRSVVKERFSKKYRHPILDSKITLRRLNAEARCMTKARKVGVMTPVLYNVDTVQHCLTFEFVDGPSVKDVFLEFGLNGIVEEKLNDIATQIGLAIAKLHDGGLVHGDLTTSNMLIRSGTNQLVLIDFGLSFTSTLPEDKAVDLYVLERALLSMHSSCGNVIERILAAYKKSSKQWCSTMNKLAQGTTVSHIFPFRFGDRWHQKSSIVVGKCEIFVDVRLIDCSLLVSYLGCIVSNPNGLGRSIPGSVLPYWPGMWPGVAVVFDCDCN